MSTLFKICQECFWTSSKSFSFYGITPSPERALCPSCSSEVVSLVRLDRKELTDQCELAFDGREVIVQCGRWRSLHKLLQDVVRNVISEKEITSLADGTLSVLLDEQIPMYIRAVWSEKQRGCLIFAPILTSSETLQKLPEGGFMETLHRVIKPVGLVITSPDTFFVGKQGAIQMYCRLFVEEPWITQNSFSLLLAEMSRFCSYVREGIFNLGYSQPLINFFKQFKPRFKELLSGEYDDKPPTDSPKYDGDQSELAGLLSNVDDYQKQFISDSLAICREQVENFLKSVACDVDSALQDDGTYNFQYRGTLLQLSIFSDDRDTYVRAISPILIGNSDYKLMYRELIGHNRSLHLGKLVLRETGGEVADVVFQDTILGNDLNMTELTKLLSNCALTALGYRIILGGDSVGQGSPSPSLNGLFEYLEENGVSEQRHFGLEHLRRQIEEYIFLLGLRPKLSPSGELRFDYGSTQVFVRLQEILPDTFITIRATVLVDFEASVSEVMEWITGIEESLTLGVFKFPTNSKLTFESTLLGIDLDLNEFAKTLQFVSEVSDRYDDELLEIFGGKRAVDTKDQRLLIDAPDSVEVFKEMMIKADDPEERLRAIQSVSFFPSEQRLALLMDALFDPYEQVADYATAVLATSHLPEITPHLPRLRQIVENQIYGDGMRKRALRIIMMFRGLEEDRKLAGSILKLLKDHNETPVFRVFLIRAMEFLGHEIEHEILLDCVQISDDQLTREAISALSVYRNKDEAIREEIASQIRKLIREGRGPIAEFYPLLAKLTDIDDVISEFEAMSSSDIRHAVGVMNALKDAGTQTYLQEFLMSSRGELRRVAYQSAGWESDPAVANAIADGLAAESDPALKLEALNSLNRMKLFTPRVYEVVEELVSDDRLRSRALGILRALRAI